MTAVDDEDDLDLMLDEVTPAPKGAAVPLKRTPKQAKALEARAAEKAEAEALAAAQGAAKAQAARLAQIVNLHISGMSFAEIGASIGATADEVDRMINMEASRYVRNQPALRTYVRNFISGRYLTMLDSVYPQATDPNRADQLEYFDRAQRVLAQMGRLHGAEAPTQSEVKVEAAPEAVERLVTAISAAQGMGYDADIFDLDPDDIHEAAVEAEQVTQVSGNAVEESDGNDDL